MDGSRRERTVVGCAYPGMADMEALLERLRVEQHSLVLEAGGYPFRPNECVVQQIADLEIKIRAIEALLEDR